jgi:hypothetical protein
LLRVGLEADEHLKLRRSTAARTADRPSVEVRLQITPFAVI